MKPTLCIYHANCADGFGAAWIVRKALGSAAVAFHAATYNREPPDVRGRNIVLVDFSYPRPALPAARPVLESMLEDAHSIRLLDHHVTARDDLAGLTHPKLTAVFDLDQSGVGVTWRHYFPDRPLPPLLAHVQDMDLYRFALPRTREILSAVYSYPYDFDTWSRLMRSSLGRLVREGAISEAGPRQGPHGVGRPSDRCSAVYPATRTRPGGGTGLQCSLYVRRTGPGGREDVSVRRDVLDNGPERAVFPALARGRH